jgi:hypothetical protein
MKFAFGGQTWPGEVNDKNLAKYRKISMFRQQAAGANVAVHCSLRSFEPFNSAQTVLQDILLIWSDFVSLLHKTESNFGLTQFYVDAVLWSSRLCHSE